MPRVRRAGRARAGAAGRRGGGGGSGRAGGLLLTARDMGWVCGTGGEDGGWTGDGLVGVGWGDGSVDVIGTATGECLVTFRHPPPSPPGG